MEIDFENKNFKIMGSGARVELFSYIKTVLDANPYSEIHIGCDSQNFARKTTYVTTIVFRFPGHGAHVVYHKEVLPRISDLWSKLWGELERSVALASWIHGELGFEVHQIDLDFNSDPNYASNKILHAASGYIQSLGFKVKAKPELLMAVWAANVLCN